MHESAVPEDELTRAVALDLVQRGLTGAAIGLRRSDGRSSSAAAGLAEIERGTPLTPDHQFRIASITKLFVFAALLRLHEAGALDLDAPVARFLPDLPYAASLTLRHVLTQTGGLPVWATNRVEDDLPHEVVWV